MAAIWNGEVRLECGLVRYAHLQPALPPFPEITEEFFMSKKFYVPIEMTKKYVGENEIYATEDGEIIRITPDKIKVIIREGKLTEVYFAEVDNEDVYNEFLSITQMVASRITKTT